MCRVNGRTQYRHCASVPAVTAGLLFIRTHRLGEGVVPQHGGRGVVVLAAVDDHHHGQGQRLERGRQEEHTR